MKRRGHGEKGHPTARKPTRIEMVARIHCLKKKIFSRTRKSKIVSTKQRKSRRTAVSESEGSEKKGGGGGVKGKKTL